MVSKFELMNSLYSIIVQTKCITINYIKKFQPSFYDILTRKLFSFHIMNQFDFELKK